MPGDQANRRGTVLRVIEAIVVTAIVGDFARVVARLIGLETPLLWDEAVYAVRSRGWLDADAPLVAWDVIRPPLLPLVASPASLATPDEAALRLVGLLAGVAVLLAAWSLTRAVAGPLAGIAVLAVLHSSPTLQQHSGYLLTDVPSTALLLLVVALVWREFELSPRPGPALAVAAFVAGFAFLTRYGAILVILPLAVLSTALWWRKIVAAPRWPLVAAAIGGGFLVGHVAWSLAMSGSPLGILRASYRAVPAWEYSPPMVMFHLWLPLELAGSAGRIAIVAGFLSVPVAAAAAVFLPSWRRPLRALVLIATLGISQVSLLVLGAPHIEQRYLIFGTVCLVTAGIALATLGVKLLPLPLRVVAIVAFLAFVIANRGPAVDFALNRSVGVGRQYEPMRLAGEEINRRSSWDCTVYGGGAPIVSWYSGCTVRPIRDAGAAGIDHDGHAWLLVFSPPGDVDVAALGMSALVDVAVDGPISVQDPRSGQTVATLWELRR